MCMLSIWAGQNLCHILGVYSIPNDKILDWFKLKAFADNKRKVNEKLKFGLGRVKKIVGKGENVGNQNFLLYPQCFQKSSVSGS